MSEFAPPGFPEEPAVPDPQAHLSLPALESALDDFRRWFSAAAASNGEAPPAPPATGIDLATLLSHYLALRQEVNLQTRAVRAQQEQSSDALDRLSQAVDLVTRQQARSEQTERQAQEEKLRPLLNTLIDLHDALSLASREIQRTQDYLLPELEELADTEALGEEPPPAPPAGTVRSIWSRWILSPSADAALRASQEETQQAMSDLQRERRDQYERTLRSVQSAQRVRSALESILTGYSMGVERIERALRKHGLEAIPTVGMPFDPEQMEVLEPVAGSGRPRNEVVEEVRRGYLLNGRVFRFALVRVAKD